MMSKRFIDTGLWQRRWFREMEPEEKVSWIYLITACDAVGVWEVDTTAAEFYIGKSIDWGKFLKASNGNIDCLSEKKWWLVDFCAYQYGRIPDEAGSKVHLHLRGLLQKHNLWTRYCLESRLESRLESAPDSKEKEKEKVKVKVKVKEEEKEKRVNQGKLKKEVIVFDWSSLQFENIIDDDITRWGELYPACNVMRELGRMVEWLKDNPTKRKTNYGRFITNWLMRSQERGGK